MSVYREGLCALGQRVVVREGLQEEEATHHPRQHSGEEAPERLVWGNEPGRDGGQNTWVPECWAEEPGLQPRKGRDRVVLGCGKCCMGPGGCQGWQRSVARRVERSR